MELGHRIYPPGPRGYPVIGSVFEVPRDVPMWKGFISMAEKFSRCPTLHWRALG